MSVMQLLGWACVAIAAIFALQMFEADRRLQAFRSAGVPARRYAAVPTRWQRDIYLPDGAPLVDAAWRNFRRMVGAGLFAVLLFALAAP